jgi:hypothetical protein
LANARWSFGGSVTDVGTSGASREPPELGLYRVGDHQHRRRMRGRRALRHLVPSVRAPVRREQAELHRHRAQVLAPDAVPHGRMRAAHLLRERAERARLRERRWRGGQQRTLREAKGNGGRDAGEKRPSIVCAHGGSSQCAGPDGVSGDGKPARAAGESQSRIVCRGAQFADIYSRMHKRRSMTTKVPVPIWVLSVSALLACGVSAQQPNPRQQPGASITMFSPEQHDLYDGHYILSANRIYMVGGLTDPVGWDHMDNEARTVRPAAGTAEIDVNDLSNTGRFEARLKIPEGDLVLAIDRFNEFNPCQNGGIVGFLHEHGTDSGCGDNNWPKTFVFLAGWGFGHATLNGKPLYDNYEMHFMITQGIRTGRRCA